MNIAVILEAGIKSGGVFQQSLTEILLLNKHKNKTYNFVFFTTLKENIDILKEYNIEVMYLDLFRFDKALSQIKRIELINRLFKRFKINKINKLDRVLEQHDIDLIYFLSSSQLSLVTENFNYIIKVWDLCHRDYMEFPEVNKFREFEGREYVFTNALPKAVKVIAESDLNRANIIRRYNIDESRVISLPMLPSNSVNISKEEYERNYIDVKKKYNIDGGYIFYPAQFWSHKNHIYILDGLKILNEKYNKKINAVFSGSDKGNLKFVLKKAGELGLEKQIYYIGFVDNKIIPYLYKQALALVMPTYFGPTNIPPLEAFKLECPVLYSNLPGLREQVQGAALLLDLTNPESLAINLLKVIENNTETQEMILNGKNKLVKWNEDNYWLSLKNVFDDYAVKLKCWK